MAKTNSAPVPEGTKIKLSASSLTFYIIAYVVVGLMALICLIPFIVIISGSFTSEQYINFHGFDINPREFTTAAYQLVFKTPATIGRA